MNPQWNVVLAIVKTVSILAFISGLNLDIFESKYMTGIPANSVNDETQLGHTMCKGMT